MDIKIYARQRLKVAIRNGTLIPDSKCSICRREIKTEGHHYDYSKPLDVIWLCRSCHMENDGRMNAIHVKHKQAPKECSNCNRMMKPLRKGLCHTCSEYVRKRGEKRPYKNDGRSEKGAMLDKQGCEEALKILDSV